jgi:hypothetical protein
MDPGTEPVPPLVGPVLVVFGDPRIKVGLQRWCFGKTPMQTYLDALPLAKEKLMAA